jgi:diadenosine tetraphosphate (Ap4A) HIT family hydrolase
MTDLDCYPCARTAELESLPPRERVFIGGGWRVAHAFNTSLPGWLVVVPMRHVERFDELTDDELRELGLLLRGCSRALRTVLGCSKTYVASFGKEVAHLHTHVIPRAHEWPPQLRGPHSFSLLAVVEDEWVPAEERDRLAHALGDSIRTEFDQGA